MYFPALRAGQRRLGRSLVYMLYQAALVLAQVLHTLAGLRSAWGGALVRAPQQERPIRPRRTGRPGRRKGLPSLGTA